MLETDSSLIDPVYSQAEPSELIDLGSVHVEFKHGAETQVDLARVTMRFTPAKRLYFVIDLKHNDFTFADDWEGTLTLTDRNVSFDAFCVHREFTNAGSGPLHFLPKKSVVTATQPSNDLATATFHLFNFPDFLGPQDYAITTGEPPRRGWKRCGRVILKADGWNITIAGTDNTGNLCKALDHHGGFIITHMGKIERDDGSPFSSEQIEGLLGCVHCFLSFALGRWAGVALPIGLGTAGKRVFEQWGMPLVAAGPWNDSLSWFDRHHSELLADVFPGFLALWNDKTWNRAIQGAVYWYLAANERGTGIGVDTGLILTQTALERLAWTYCVLDREISSPDEFRSRKLSAAEKIRRLMSALDIPVDLPGHMTALGEIRDPAPQDAADAITRVRNFIVHPHAKKQLPDGSYYEAWKLSLWYLDMAFLRLCGHRGSYANRLVRRRTGQVKPVPWAQPKTVEETDQ